MTDAIKILPANEATCDDLQAILGDRGYAAACQCQRFKTPGREWDAEWPSGGVERRAKRLREQRRCGLRTPP